MQGDWSYWNSLALKMADEEEAKKKQAIEDEKALKEALTIDVNKVTDKRQARQLKPQFSVNSEPVFPVLEEVLKEFSYSETIELVRTRMILGLERYGQELHSFNGRDCKLDAIEEILDCMQYVTQQYMEQTASDLLTHSDKARIKYTYKKTINLLLEVLFNVEDNLQT